MALIAMTAAAVMFLQNTGTVAGAEIAANEARRLETCVAKIETAPSEAYEDGLAWTFEGNRPGARQCTALALIALGNVEEGAIRLERLATAVDGGTMEQRALYFAQAGNAWMQIGAAEAAAVAFTEALKLMPATPELLLDRASAHMLIDRWSEAKSDLDRLIADAPEDGLAHQMRAEVFLNLGDYDAAMRDVQAAMAADPKNIDTLLVRGRVREAIRLKTEAGQRE
ncbi:tetratricopeptide repeat protein [Hyphomonas sp.]|uniref:tetratricopeptide repeat protein n=1 Tax=Hyphomonas sp. TaxID=87 RepID=UPI00391DAF3A